MFDSFISDAAARWDVPAWWIETVIDVESSWNPNAYRNEPAISDGSYGLMQLLTRTASGLGYSGPPSGLFDPETNIGLGSKLLGQLRQQYGDDFRRVYSAYNSGQPDLWETSPQVAANVTRALQAAAKWVAENPAADTGATLLVVALLAGWWWWKKSGHA